MTLLLSRFHHHFLYLPKIVKMFNSSEFISRNSVKLQLFKFSVVSLFFHLPLLGFIPRVFSDFLSRFFIWRWRNPQLLSGLRYVSSRHSAPLSQSKLASLCGRASKSMSSCSGSNGMALMPSRSSDEVRRMPSVPG